MMYVGGKMVGRSDETRRRLGMRDDYRKDTINDGILVDFEPKSDSRKVV